MIRRPIAFAPALRPLRSRPGITRPFPRPTVLARANGPASGQVAAKAWESTMTGDEKSGHIAAGANESIVFFDSEDRHFPC